MTRRPPKAAFWNRIWGAQVIWPPTFQPRESSGAQGKQLLRLSAGLARNRLKPLQNGWALRLCLVHEPSGHYDQMLCLSHEALVHGRVVAERRRAVFRAVIVAGLARQYGSTAQRTKVRCRCVRIPRHLLSLQSGGRQHTSTRRHRRLCCSVRP